MTKRIDNTRLIILALGAVLAVFAIIGAIGLLAVSGSGMEIDVGDMDSMSDMDGLGQISSIFVFHDFARFGTFGIFALAVVYFIYDYMSEKKFSAISVAFVVCSLFGFAAVFMISFKSIIDAVFSALTSAMSNSYYSSSSVSNPLEGVKALATVGVIFIMLSAAAALVLFIAALVIRFKPQGYANPYGYGYPNQQYPQQYPQQFPQQFPQQSDPVQPVQQPVQPVQQPVYTAPAPAPMPAPVAAPIADWTCSCGSANPADAKFCFTCGKPRQ